VPSLCGGNGKNAKGRVRDRPEKLLISLHDESEEIKLCSV